MEYKYLILRDKLDQEYPVIWPKSLDQTNWQSGVSHKEMSRVHSASNIRVVSAGFCTIGNNAKAFGKSESLNMDSRPEDTQIIQQFFGTPA